ncbi:ABC transporter substrate-binding protein [Reyranella sp.]|uniref:ABC transporter substrate-binding protein n=1 Tax=Reyranella sp. TaxID=1929291 RepID=UPI003BAB010A
MALTRRSFSVLSSLLSVAGLTATRATAQDFKGEGGKVRVASFPGGNDYPFWAIAKLGLDRKYGFELENVSVQPGGAALTAFRSGAVEGGLMNWLELARVRTAGEEIAAIVPFLEMPNVWVVPRNSPAKTVADLKGRKVGTYNRFSPEWVLYLSTAKSKFGYDPRTESTIQEAGPGLLRGLMDQKQIDATFIFYNLAMPMVASGEYRILFNSKDLLKLAGMPTSTMLTSVAFREAYGRSNPKNVRAFAMAYRDAVEYLRANDPIWVECLARQNIIDAAVVPLMRDYSRDVTMARFSADPMGETRQLFELLYATGGKEAMGVDALPTGIFNTSFSS